MKHTRTLLLVGLALLLAFNMIGCDALPTGEDDSIQASGVIEVHEVSVAPEVDGNVAEVFVEEGQSVKTGDPLLRIEDELLNAQRDVLLTTLDSARASVASTQAGVEAAQTQYDLLLTNAQSAEYESRAGEWQADHPDELDQNNWYFSDETRIAAAQTELDAAIEALKDTEERLETIEENAASADFLAAEKRLVEARAAFLVADAVLDQADESGSNDLKDAAQIAYDDALQELEDAQEKYDNLFTTEGAEDVLEARSKRAVAEERYRIAHQNVLAWQTGERSLEVLAAARAVDQAQAQVTQAEATVKQAEAELALLDLQIEKLTVVAPLDGVVLTRSVNPGELVTAGGVVLTIGQLDDLSVTVYIPENHYGQIHLGDTATLSVDSFPDKTFHATVTKIADQAEYTPRNVQTKEERQTTVYAVKLIVENPDSELKPGMPADVTFEETQP